MESYSYAFFPVLLFYAQHLRHILFCTCGCSAVIFVVLCHATMWKHLHLVIHSSAEEHLCGSQFSAVINSVAKHPLVDKIVLHWCTSFLQDIGLGMEIWGPRVYYYLDFTVHFQSSCITFFSRSSSLELLLLPIPCQPLALVYIFTNHVGM